MSSFIETPQDTNISINCKGKTLNLNTPQIMGILNLTPDSFFDGGKNVNETAILKRVSSMIQQGASIIDVGGQSTRPGAKMISTAAELERVIPIIKLLKTNFKNSIISIDTFKSEVAQKAVEAGASIVNDISGGTLDTNMFKTIGKLKVPYILMHIKGSPENMQENPSYKNLIEEVKLYFSEKITALKTAGVENIILDLGFGFGKTLEHNYELLNHLHEFHSFNLPILTGISRKSMITKTLKITPNKALNGTTTLNTIALLKGSHILRVHDVKEAKECVLLTQKTIATN